MNGKKAKAIRRIAKSKAEGLTECAYEVIKESKYVVHKDPATGHKQYIKPPGTFALTKDCQRKIYRDAKKTAKSL